MWWMSAWTERMAKCQWIVANERQTWNDVYNSVWDFKLFVELFCSLTHGLHHFPRFVVMRRANHKLFYLEKDYLQLKIVKTSYLTPWEWDIKQHRDGLTIPSCIIYNKSTIGKCGKRKFISLEKARNSLFTFYYAWNRVCCAVNKINSQPMRELGTLCLASIKYATGSI